MEEAALCWTDRCLLVKQLGASWLWGSSEPQFLSVSSEQNPVKGELWWWWWL